MGLVQGRSAAAGSRSSTRHTILVVDDEPSIRRFVARAVDAAVVDVVEAADGSEAIAVFESDPDRFVAIICDLTLTGASGEDVVRAVRGARPGLPVLVITGWDRETAVQVLGQVGPVEWLQKPFTFTDLRAAIERVLPAS